MALPTSPRRHRLSKRQAYVLLPSIGIRSAEMGNLGTDDQVFAKALHARLIPSNGSMQEGARKLEILHSMQDDGPKLAELSADELAALRNSSPGVRAVPLVYYHTTGTARPQWRAGPRSKLKRPGQKAGRRTDPVLVKVTDPAGQPVRGATVVAIEDLAQQRGVQGRTNANGEAKLRIAPVKLEALLVYGPPFYWGHCKTNVLLNQRQDIRIQPIDLAIDDFLGALYAKVPPDAGRGVAVGVIDTGVDGAHPHLNLTHTRCFVTSEGDAGSGTPATMNGTHGTHVAGIIGSTGQKPYGKRGVAPGCTLHSYRVFANKGGGATNYDILRAIEQAVEDHCDLVNLSLGSSTPDEAVHDAIKDAFDRGTLCIAAAGNDARGEVLYPARWAEAVCVGAVGRRGMYPSSSSEVFDEVAPSSRLDKEVYVARFSNEGPEMKMVGPGAGIVSTLPDGGYGVMSGTSMACPAVTGLAAALLGARPDILGMPRDAKRTTALLGALNQACIDLGLHQDLQGIGVPLWSHGGI